MDFRTLNILFKAGKEFGHRKIKNSGISDTGCMICSFVCSHQGCAQDDVVKAFHMDKTTTAKAMKTLEDKGYIIRNLDEEDRRRKSLSVTPLAEEKLSKIFDLHEKWMTEVMTVLSGEEQAKFEEYCIRLIEAAEKMKEENC